MIIDKSKEPLLSELQADGFELQGKELWVKKRTMGGYHLKKRCGRCGFFMQEVTGREVQPKIVMGCAKSFCDTFHEIKFRGGR